MRPEIAWSNFKANGYPEKAHPRKVPKRNNQHKGIPCVYYSQPYSPDITAQLRKGFPGVGKFRIRFGPTTPPVMTRIT
ncbi:hypothetical protein CEXT_431521 [Caerostris extrusa]|uniref:Uncharacterized protein n=1 Tax=Caerostris extrusa TaxID=172846 RepID=A0AAV4QP97_CAEEX|nr:hypothetical protein CEXT_431521 [Caerostris extrusa]